MIQTSVPSFQLNRVYILFWIILFHTFHSEAQILPTPTVYKTVGNRSLVLPNEISIDPTNISEELKDYLTVELKSRFALRVIYSKAGRHLTFKHLLNVPQDQYTIAVEDRITISYSSQASCFYAINSLFQLVKIEENYYVLDDCFVMDQPKFKWRGMHLDVSRHFSTVEEVKRYIDLISFYKFNTFHWHLTDDQGWRIEIKKYPKLTEVGAWRDSTVNNHYTTSPRIYTKERYGGFYTQEQIKEVVKYAESKFVTVVPEIEMPGHARAALAAYPEMSCTGEQHGVEGLWGVFDDIFCSKKETISFLQDVLTEVVALFPSQYIHIGGDEAPKTRWKECVKCQKTITDNHLKDEHELQSWFIRQMDEFLTSKGKKLIGWDEILEGGLSPNAAVMSWRGFEGGIEAAAQEHFVVMSPGGFCYFDHYQSRNAGEPLAFGGFTPLEKVYQFSPIADKMTPQEAGYVLGGQANMWTEYIPDFKQVEYMLFPRAIALAQTLWCESKPEYDKFLEILTKYHLPELTRRNVNWSHAMFYPEMKIKRAENGVTVSFSADKGSNLEITRNGEKVESTVILERPQNNTVYRNEFSVQSNNLDRTSNFTVIQHQSLGLPLEFVTKPSDRYNANGELNLVDGILGDLPWKGSDWTGYDTNHIEIIMDLQGSKMVDNLQFRFLNAESSWIHLPKSIQVSVSKNKKKWKALTVDVPVWKAESDIGIHLYKIAKKTNYLKFTIEADKIPAGKAGEGNYPWIFMDEIILNAFDK